MTLDIMLNQHAGLITYIENNKTTKIFVRGQYPEFELSLKDIRYWEMPFDDEEISIEEKRRILKNVYDDFIKHNVSETNLKFDFSLEGNFVLVEEIILLLERNYNYVTTRYFNGQDIKVPMFQECIVEQADSFVGEFSYIASCYYNLPVDGNKKFKQEIENNINLQSLLINFAKWKVSDGILRLDQKRFKQGLYALDMALIDDNRQEVKEVLEQYKKVSQQRRQSKLEAQQNFSFDNFLRQLDEIEKRKEENRDANSIRNTLANFENWRRTRSFLKFNPTDLAVTLWEFKDYLAKDYREKIKQILEQYKEVVAERNLPNVEKEPPLSFEDFMGRAGKLNELIEEVLGEMA